MARMALSHTLVRADCLIAALDHALLVVAGGLIVGVDDGVGGHAVGVVGLGPGVDGVDIGVGVEEKGEHFCEEMVKKSQRVIRAKLVLNPPTCESDFKFHFYSTVTTSV